MAKIQEEMNQRAHATSTTPTAITTTMVNLVHPQGNTPVQILVWAPDGAPPPVFHPPIIKIYDQQDAFFSPIVASIYDAFGPPTNEV